MLLVLAFVLFLAGYVVYARFLGGIDGLPAPPEGYSPTQAPLGPYVEPVKRISDLDEQLQVAFGQECPELGYPIKFQVKPKGMVLAAKECVFEKDSPRVRLSPLSVAVFAKNTNDGKHPEINTVRS